MDRYTTAIMALEDYKLEVAGACGSLEAVNIAIEALEKQVDKPVVVSPREGYMLPDYRCPTCGEKTRDTYFSRRDGRYCDRCGQRLAF